MGFPRQPGQVAIIYTWTPIVIGGLTLGLLFGLCVAFSFVSGFGFRRFDEVKTTITRISDVALPCHSYCNGYASTCTLAADCPVVIGKAGVAVTAACSYGTCVYTYAPPGLALPATSPGNIPAAICLQAFNDADARSCLVAEGVVSSDAVTSCIAVSGCANVADDAFDMRRSVAQAREEMADLPALDARMNQLRKNRL